MAKIKQKGTKIETIVAITLRDMGLHYRKNVKSLPGNPDFANKSRLWAVFVNGCYWHHHTGCSKATVPKSNTEFWTDKFRANRRRDARAINSLKKKGYHVVVIWECQTDRIREKLHKIPESGRVDCR